MTAKKSNTRKNYKAGKGTKMRGGSDDLSALYEEYKKAKEGLPKEVWLEEKIIYPMERRWLFLKNPELKKEESPTTEVESTDIAEYIRKAKEIKSKSQALTQKLTLKQALTQELTQELIDLLNEAQQAFDNAVENASTKELIERLTQELTLTQELKDALNEAQQAFDKAVENASTNLQTHVATDASTKELIERLKQGLTPKLEVDQKAAAKKALEEVEKYSLIINDVKESLERIDKLYRPLFPKSAGGGKVRRIKKSKKKAARRNKRSKMSKKGSERL